ncbi:MAG: hypothetical protein M3R41_02000 [Pseudomonadota bacterium]|nr:hypothetical protein [Pseudomonadota bacterium]
MTRRGAIPRRALAIGAGLAVAVLVILAIEAADEWLYPIATGIDADDPGALATMVFAMPFPAQALMVFGWFAGAFAGAWIALRVCDWRWAGWIIVMLTIAGGVFNLFQFAHPWWMQAATILAPLVAGWLAARWHRRPYPGEPLLG